MLEAFSGKFTWAHTKVGAVPTEAGDGVLQFTSAAVPWPRKCRSHAHTLAQVGRQRSSQTHYSRP
jgi:hypothetical protein